MTTGADGAERIADEPQRFGGAALHEQRLVGERHHQWLARGAIADQPKRKRRHLPDFGFAVSKQRDERRHAAREPHPPDGKRRAAAQPRLLVG